MEREPNQIDAMLASLNCSTHANPNSMIIVINDSFLHITKKHYIRSRVGKESYVREIRVQVSFRTDVSFFIEIILIHIIFRDI